MKGIKITMTGADSAYYGSKNNRVARAYSYPDNIVRCISLRGWQWDAFDQFSKENQVDPLFLIEQCFQGAMEIMVEFNKPFEEMENQIRSSLDSLTMLSAGLSPHPNNDNKTDV